MYGVQISKQPSAAAFVRGPASLHCTAFDVWTHSTFGTDLTLVAGQQNTYTALHSDPGAESVWQLLVEGQKLRILGRPDYEGDMKAAMPDDRAVQCKRITDAVEGWMVDQRTMVVVQNAGDLLYLPRGWPHVVKHYTDTIAINSSLLRAWDFPYALHTVDFATLSAADFRMYEQGMDAMRQHRDLQRMSRVWMDVLEQLWAQRKHEYVDAQQQRQPVQQQAEGEEPDSPDEREEEAGPGGRKRKRVA